MAFESISPNMSMPIPGVSLTIGPQWASDVNACLTILDGHDHSPGYGVQVTPAGLNINTDLTFANNNAISLRSSRYTPQGAALAGVSDLGCVYVAGVDLYFNDVNGNQIRITQSGGVAGTPGSISGLVSPASATYVGLSSTFVWQSNVNTPANLDAASIILRNLSAGSFGLTLNPPAAMGADYSLVLPNLPGAQSFMTLDASGNMGASISTAGGITSSNIASGTITSSNISPTAGITGSQLASATVAQSNLAPSAINDSIQSVLLTGSGNFTVPAGVTRIWGEIVGGGGGGGGGAGGVAGAGNSGPGGGGGASGEQIGFSAVVTPSQVIAYSAGAGGALGSGGASGGNGSAGGNGGTSYFGDFKAKGGAGGAGGVYHGSAGSGGSSIVSGNNGGAGGAPFTAGSNGEGLSNYGAAGPSGGFVSPGTEGGGGGGGGGASFKGAGGKGGAGQNASNNTFAQAPDDGTYGAGAGGGGGARTNTGNNGQPGATGGDGYIQVFYVVS